MDNNNDLEETNKFNTEGKRNLYLFLVDFNKKDNLMEIDQNDQTNFQGKMSLGKLGQNLFVTPNFSEQNPSQLNIQNNSNSSVKNIVERPLSELGNIIKKKYSEKKMMRSFYVYYALKVINC